MCWHIYDFQNVQTNIILFLMHISAIKIFSHINNIVSINKQANSFWTILLFKKKKRNKIHETATSKECMSVFAHQFGAWRWNSRMKWLKANQFDCVFVCLLFCMSLSYSDDWTKHVLPRSILWKMQIYTVKKKSTLSPQKIRIYAWLQLFKCCRPVFQQRFICISFHMHLNACNITTKLVTINAYKNQVHLSETRWIQANKVK